MTHPVIEYWEERYRKGKRGRGSGAGSRGPEAERKAAFINDLIRSYKVSTLVDWGCGDGRVAALIRAPHYIGLEVSARAFNRCRKRADGTGREWHLFDGAEDPDIRGDLALSLDVIFHLVEDDLYHRHLELVFGSAPLVCIASSNYDQVGQPHVRHRVFVGDVPQGWTVTTRPPDDSIGFWVFRKDKA